MIPITTYFHGEGKKVMSDMKKRYGKKKAKKVFYAMAPKRGSAKKLSGRSFPPAPVREA